VTLPEALPTFGEDTNDPGRGMTTTNLTVHVASGEPLDVRDFNVEQHINANFEVSSSCAVATPR